MLELDKSQLEGMTHWCVALNINMESNRAAYAQIMTLLDQEGFRVVERHISIHPTADWLYILLERRLHTGGRLP